MLVIIDLMGWVGSIVLVVAYLLNSINKLDAQSFAYQFMNFLGGGFLIINTLFYGAYPSSFLNLIWAIIAGAYLIRLNNEKRALKTQ